MRNCFLPILFLSFIISFSSSSFSSSSFDQSHFVHKHLPFLYDALGSDEDVETWKLFRDNLSKLSDELKEVAGSAIDRSTFLVKLADRAVKLELIKQALIINSSDVYLEKFEEDYLSLVNAKPIHISPLSRIPFSWSDMSYLKFALESKGFRWLRFRNELIKFNSEIEKTTPLKFSEFLTQLANRAVDLKLICLALQSTGPSGEDHLSTFLDKLPSEVSEKLRSVILVQMADIDQN